LRRAFRRLHFPRITNALKVLLQMSLVLVVGAKTR
jgi:hypothetical protein